MKKLYQTLTKSRAALMVLVTGILLLSNSQSWAQIDPSYDYRTENPGCNSNNYTVIEIFLAGDPLDPTVPVTAGDIGDPIDAHIWARYTSNANSSVGAFTLYADQIENLQDGTQTGPTLLIKCQDILTSSQTGTNVKWLTEITWSYGSELILDNPLIAWTTANNKDCSNVKNFSQCDYIAGIGNYIVVTTPLVPGFTTNKECIKGNEYETVTYTSTTTGGIPPYSYSWDLGDPSDYDIIAGGIDQEFIQVTFKSQGNKNVTLEITDDDEIPESESTSDNVDIQPVPAIIEQPGDQNIAYNSISGLIDPVTFSLTATGVLSYQWQYSVDGANWTNVVDGVTWADASGAISTALTFTPEITDDGKMFQCLLNTGYNCPVTSDPANLIALVSCPTPDITADPADATNVCIGSSVSFSVIIGGAVAAHDFQWYKGTPPSGTLIPGATDQTYTIDPVAATDAGDYYVVVTNACGGEATSESASLTVLPDAAVTSVSGTSPLCIGASATYITTGEVLGGGTGVWSSNDESVATVNPTTGLVTAVAPGTATITYTITGGCNGTPFASQTVEVLLDADVTSVSGTSPLCIGTSAIYTTTGEVLGGGTGTWSSDDETVATVNPTTGLVTAVAPGTATITYTITGGCNGTPFASQNVEVLQDADVTSVSGTSPLCIGASTTYAASGVDFSGGTGAWSSNNTNIATVDPSTGEVTAVGAGTCDIIYTVTGGCGGTASAYQPVTVNPLPTCQISDNEGTILPGVVNISPLSTVTFCAPADMAYQWSVTDYVGNDPNLNLTANAQCIKVNDPGTYNVIITDANGCSSTCSIELAYNTIPLPYSGSDAVCPGSTNTYGIEGVTIPEGFTFLWTLEDNTSGASILGDSDGSSVEILAGTSCNASYKVYLKIYNANNNLAFEGGKTVSVIDDTPPSITTQATSPTVECDGAGNTDAFNAWLSSNGGASASDDCSGVTWSNDFDEANWVTGCGLTKSVTVEFTATDDCTNANSTTGTFTIEDTQAPTIDVAATSPTVECDGAGNTDAFNAWLSSNGGASASDDCSGVTWSNDFDEANWVTGCGLTKSVTVEFTATDDCTNANSTTGTFTIEDTQAPAITAGEDQTVDTDEGECGAYVSVSATATDACSGDLSPTGTRDDELELNEMYPVGTTIITWNVSDACGNAATPVTQTVTVNPIEVCGDYTGTLFANTTIDKDETELEPALVKMSVSFPESELVCSTCDLEFTLTPDGRAVLTFDDSNEENGWAFEDPDSEVEGDGIWTYTEYWYVSLVSVDYSDVIQLTWQFDGDCSYTINTDVCDNLMLITVSKPTDDFVTGGGYLLLKDPDPDGELAGSKDTKNNFGFNVKWAKNYSRLKGNINTIWRVTDEYGEIIHMYQARSNKPSTLIITEQFTDPDDKYKLTGYRVDLIFSNVNVIELKGIYGGGAGYIIMTFYDWGEPGSTNPAQPQPDLFGFAVLDNKDNLLYATNDFDYDRIMEGYMGEDESFPVLLDDLTKGNTQVHAGPTNQENTKAAEITTAIEPVMVENAEMKVYPNPFSDKIRFDFVSPIAAQAKIDVYDMTGRIVQTIFDDFVQENTQYNAVFKPEVEVSGMYFYRMQLGDTIYNGKLIYKEK